MHLVLHHNHFRCSGAESRDLRFFRSAHNNRGGGQRVTGPFGFIGTPQKQAIETVAEDVNKKGGINGRPLQILIEDEYTPATLDLRCLPVPTECHK
jgi:hypothetical protein